MLVRGVQVSTNKRLGGRPDPRRAACSGFTSVAEAGLSSLLDGGLQTAELGENLFAAVPSELERCAGLRQLDLSRNFISSIGGSLLGLRQLVRLNLAHNRLRRVESHELAGLRSLKTLILAHNELARLPQLDCLPKLRVLHLEANAFSALPASVARLPELRELRLDWPLYLDPPRAQSLLLEALGPRLADASLPSLALERLGELCACKEELGSDCLALDEFLCRFSSAARSESLYALVCRAVDARHQGIAQHFAQSALRDAQPLDDGSGELLSKALRANCEWLADQLLAADCSVSRETALLQAVRTCSRPLLEKLLDAGLDADACDADGNTPLHLLFVAALRRLLTAHQRRVSSAPRPASLCRAAPQGSGDCTESRSLLQLVEEALEALLRRGASPDRYNRAGLACWHPLLRDEGFALFRLLRASRLSAVRRLDWLLPAAPGAEHVLRRASRCREEGFLLELLATDRRDLLVLDDRLLLPLQACLLVPASPAHKRLLGLSRKALRLRFFAPGLTVCRPLLCRPLRSERLGGREKVVLPRAFLAEGMQRVEATSALSASRESLEARPVRQSTPTHSLRSLQLRTEAAEPRDASLADACSRLSSFPRTKHLLLRPASPVLHRSVPRQPVLGSVRTLRSAAETSFEATSFETAAEQVLWRKTAELLRGLGRQAVALLDFEQRGVWVKPLSELSSPLQQLLLLSSRLQKQLLLLAGLAADRRDQLSQRLLRVAADSKPLQLLHKWLTRSCKPQLEACLRSGDRLQLLRLASLADACKWLASLDFDAAARHAPPTRHRPPVCEAASHRQSTSGPVSARLVFDKQLLQRSQRQQPLSCAAADRLKSRLRDAQHK